MLVSVEQQAKLCSKDRVGTRVSTDGFSYLIHNFLLLPMTPALFTTHIQILQHTFSLYAVLVCIVTIAYSSHIAYYTNP